MAGARQDSRLQTPTARSALKIRHQPYWLNIAQGVAVGYRRGAKGGTWYCRVRGRRPIQANRSGQRRRQPEVERQVRSHLLRSAGARPEVIRPGIARTSAWRAGRSHRSRSPWGLSRVVPEASQGDQGDRGGGQRAHPAETRRSGGAGSHVETDPGLASCAKRLSTGRLGDALVFTRDGEARWGKNHQVRPITFACVAAKIIPAVTFHELRHTYASTLAQRGVDLLTISKLLGHADMRVTARHYAHLCDATLKAAVEKLPDLHMMEETNVETIVRAS